MGQRIIKFRAWIDDSSAWSGTKRRGMFTGFTFESIYAGRDEANTTCEDGRTIEEPQWDKITLMQFTGLHDKNGREIYEGDILSGSPYGRPHKIVVEMIGYRWTARNFYIGSMDTPNEPFSEGSSVWEVAGNIHENPELIKEKK